MQEQTVLTPSDETSNANPTFDLGTLLGRHQAFGMMANKCSAADAHSLREIRRGKLYRAIGLTWEEFCPRHAGICHKTADQIIHRLEELGDGYFDVSQIISLSVAEYRALEPAAGGSAIEFGGERIAITRESAAKIIEAVRAVRSQIRVEREQRTRMPEIDAVWDALRNQLNRCFERINGFGRLMHHSKGDVEKLVSLIVSAEKCLAEIRESLTCES
jgi:hypothetical protein